jgi:hypothetical protein
VVFNQYQLRSKIIPYVITKLSGAGLSLSVFYTFLLLLSGFDMYKFVEEISKWSYWIIFFGYGIVCSVVIDLLTSKITRITLTLKILLYVIAGYAFFIIQELNASTLFAGTVGAICALIFYFGTYASKKTTLFPYVFVIAVPLFFIILMNYDFTEKIQWTEVRSDSTYTASFDYFNGKHEIPIRATKGQTITISIDVTNTNGGGYGFHVLNEKDKLVGMIEESGGKMKINAQNTGVYRIVLTGDDLKGSFKVVWSIEETN